MRFAIGFIFTAILLTFIWWLGGYDFDHRSPDVAFGFGMSVFVSFMGGIFAAMSKH